MAIGLQAPKAEYEVLLLQFVGGIIVASILGLIQCHNDTNRKLKEQHLIFYLGSLQPNGLNVDFTYAARPAKFSPVFSLFGPENRPLWSLVIEITGLEDAIERHS
eukprot:g32740.t1